MPKWLETLPTTNARIVVTLSLTVATAVRYLVWGVPVRMSANVAVLDGWGYWLLFLAGMAGLDVAQYVGKRFSDTGYAAASNAGPAIPPAPPVVNVSSAPAIVEPVTSSTITEPAASATLKAVHPTGEAG